MLRDSERADDLNDRANTFFGYVLLGKTDTGDLAEYERSARALQDELCAPRTVCEDCGCEEFCIDYLRDEAQDAIVGPTRSDQQRLEEWYESETDIPY